MSRGAARAVLAIAVVLILAGAAWWWWNGRGQRDQREAEQAAAAGAAPVALSVELYFPAAPEGLAVERRQLATTQVPRDQVQKIVEALLQGPQGKNLGRPLPEGVTVGGVVLVPDGTDYTAYVDLRWADHEDPPAGGSMAEMQTVYSLVNSIAGNVPQVTQVALLWNGSQRLSFSGHLDTSRPLAPNRALAIR